MPATASKNKRKVSAKSNGFVGSKKKTGLLGNLRANKKVMAGLVVGFALIGALGTWRTFAALPLVGTIRVDQMQLPAGATVATDRSADNGIAVKFTQNGVATGVVDLVGDASQIRLLVRGSRCQNDWPKLKLLVDNLPVYSQAVRTTQWDLIRIKTKVPKGRHTVSVIYSNALTSDSCNRNLYLDRIRFHGEFPVIIPTPPPAPTPQPPTTPPPPPTPPTTPPPTTTPPTTPPPTTPPPPTPPPTSGTMWKPTAEHPLNFHWVLGGVLNTNDPVAMGLRDFSGNVLPEPEVYDIDGEMNSKALVDYLHSRGKKVICYFDAGVYEDYRTDANKFPQSVIGAADDGWEGSYWLDIRQIAILEPIMKARIQMCKDKGFDSIEPDEITNWSNNPGFPITYQDQLNYNRALAGWAHAAGLSIGLKGDLEQAHDLVGNFDWALIEECFQYNECLTIDNSGGPGADGKAYPGAQLFSQQNKAVWIAEYKLTETQFTNACNISKTNKFNTYVFKLGLPTNGGRKPCPSALTTGW